jgi:hypothetical protein
MGTKSGRGGTLARISGGRFGRCPFEVDAVEKVFFGWSTKILRTADAVRVRRPEGPHRFIQKRPPAFLLGLEELVAAAVLKKILSRDFRGLSIFDFFRQHRSKTDLAPSANEVSSYLNNGHESVGYKYAHRMLWNFRISSIGCYNTRRPATYLFDGYIDQHSS